MDLLSEFLGVHCCWVQLLNPLSRNLRLVSSRGFTNEIQREMTIMNMNHRFSNEIVGLGHKIIIPNLSRDGRYGMAIFERAGFRSLIAVPIMTYKIHGTMGAAYRDRKRFSHDFSQLLAVIASLLGMALSKCTPEEQSIKTEDRIQRNDTPRTKVSQKGTIQEKDTIVNEVADINGTPQDEDRDKIFQIHADKMSAFRKSHKTHH
jgi:transcriptional regulator with GAF, ATPase, and Fis domain